MSMITVIGSSNTDMIMQLDKIPFPGETLIGNQFSTAPGGKGANQAVASARLGGNVSFIGCVGNDQLGDSAIKILKNESININYVKRSDKNPSGVAFIFVDKEGQNSIGVASGANFDIKVEDIVNSEHILSKSSVILTQLETPMDVIEKAANISKNYDSTFILNPAPYQSLSDDLIKNIDIITPNRTEVRQMTGIDVVDSSSAQKASNILHDKGIKTVIITMGKKGSFFSRINEKFLMVDPYKVKSIDSTAAGDVFNGAIACALSKSKGISESIKFANAAAALSTTKLGAIPSAPTNKEVEDFIKNN